MARRDDYNPVASEIPFDNSTNGFVAEDAQAAIEENRDGRFQYLQFQFIGEMNYDQYLYSFIHSGGETRRSGDASNGYRYSNSAPLAMNFTGNISSASASITGIARSSAPASSDVTVLFELWKVGFSGEGTKLGDITFVVDYTRYTIGNWYNSSILTSFAENQVQNVDVTAGDLLGLKFKAVIGSTNVVAVTNCTIVLEALGSV